MNILVVRDPRESSAKCSLTPLRGKAGIRFVEHRGDRRVDAGERILLHPDGSEIAEADQGRDLLLVDCPWRRLDRILSAVDGELSPRRLPALKTAYPRRSKTFADPAEGLASVEALYAATVLLGEPRPDLLEGYRWREEFLRLNPELAAPASR